MNNEAKKFILSDPNKNKYRLALSLKVSKNKIINDESVIIYNINTLEKILNLIHLINQKIDTRIAKNFHHKNYLSLLTKIDVKIGLIIVLTLK